MDLLERVDALIEDRHLLRHPFYTRWVAGTLPMDAIQEYARQYYGFESAFPRFLSALHSRSADPEVRAALLDNLWDEEHGEANHAELWLRFAEGLGVAREDVVGAERNEATRGLVDTYAGWSSRGPVAAGVAGLYAYEAQVPRVATAKVEGLKDRYGITDPRTLGFFETHATLDVEHSEAERRIISGQGAGHESDVVEATADALDAWWGFLDALVPAEA
jgi:pyrroloquinoline-quinone synthase